MGFRMALTRIGAAKIGTENLLYAGRNGNLCVVDGGAIGSRCN